MNAQMAVGEPGGVNSAPHEEKPAAVLVENSATDSCVDHAVYDAVAHLSSAGHDGVSTYETPDGDTWLQIVRHQIGDESLDDVAFSSYRDLFSCLKNRAGSLVRVWNYIPHILAMEEAVVRYHRFNAGRKKAWELFCPKTGDGRLLFPAATGIGVAESLFCVRALFSRYPVIRLQNPRQIPPDRYSKKYGPLPPVFSRASILLRPDRHQLFVSGTASIVGEDATYVGDPILQTEETLSNIRRLIDGDNCRRYGYEGEFTFEDMKSMLVYVKRAEHLECVRETIQKYVFCPTTYRRADLCREELLVEIECISDKRPAAAGHRKTF